MAGYLMGFLGGSMLTIFLGANYISKELEKERIEQIVVDDSRAYTLDVMGRTNNICYATTNGIYQSKEALERQLRNEKISKLESEIKQEIEAIK